MPRTLAYRVDLALGTALRQKRNMVNATLERDRKIRLLEEKNEEITEAYDACATRAETATEELDLCMYELEKEKRKAGKLPIYVGLAFALGVVIAK